MTTIRTRPSHDIATTGPATTPWSALARHVSADLAPGAAARDQRGGPLTEAFATLRQRGLTAAPIPSALGGGGASHADACAILRELAQGCPATAVTLAMHYHLLCTQVWRYRHDQPAEPLLRRIADEQLVLVTSGASDWLGSSGSARRVTDGWRVSARKAPASGCEVGDVLVTSIRVDDTADGPSVLHCSIPLDAQGVSIERTWDTLGLRATGSHTVVLEEVLVRDAAVTLTRPADRWHPVWNAVLGTALPLIMSAYLGIADAAVTSAIDLARNKATAPHVAPTVGAMRNQLAIAEDAVAAMIARADDLRFPAGDDAADFALTRKTVAAEALVDCVRLAVDVAGGAGYSRTQPLERWYRDILGATFHPLPRAKQVRFSGRHALGLDLAG